MRVPSLIYARPNLSAQPFRMQVEVGSFPMRRTSFLSRKKAFTLRKKSLLDLRKSLPARKKAYLKRQMSFPSRRKSQTLGELSRNTPIAKGVHLCGATNKLVQYDVGQ